MYVCLQISSLIWTSRSNSKSNGNFSIATHCVCSLLVRRHTSERTISATLCKYNLCLVRLKDEIFVLCGGVSLLDTVERKILYQTGRTQKHFPPKISINYWCYQYLPVAQDFYIEKFSNFVLFFIYFNLLCAFCWMKMDS